MVLFCNYNPDLQVKGSQSLNLWSLPDARDVAVVPVEYQSLLGAASQTRELGMKSNTWRT